MTDRYAVFGNPVTQSKSPAIHQMFAEQTGEELVYTRQQVPIGEFDRAADEFFAAGGKGLNITVPFKQDAYSYAAKLSARSRHAGAVNTLAARDGVIVGDTTDGIGLIRDITTNLGWQLAGKRVLVLGAGGAVRGVLEPLLEQLPQHVVIANRTLSRALQLSRAFAEMGYLCGCDFEMLEGQQFDVIINGTSASLQGELPPLPDDMIATGGNAYDMMYAAEPTVFLRWAQQLGAAETADGLGMLVEQAAESFNLWRGVMPETRSVIDKIRNELS